MKTENFIIKTVAIVTILMHIWIGLSYAEVLIKNTNSEPEYNKNNILVNVMEKMEDLMR